jgi:hypothetical protein
VLAKGYDGHSRYEYGLTAGLLEFNKFSESRVCVLSAEQRSCSLERHISIYHEARLPVPMAINVVTLRGIYTFFPGRLRFRVGR